jgi:hypothetical protein
MHLERGKVRHGINGRWRCSVRLCIKSKSLFEKAMFENSHLPISATLRII